MCKVQLEASGCWCTQGLILGPVLFSIVNDLCDGSEYTLGKSADCTKLGGVSDTAGGCAAIQRDLSRLEERVEGNLMKFNIQKGEVLLLGRNNPVF